MAMYLKFKGVRYSGMDGGEKILLREGAIATVSDSKGKQLLTDFPKDFEEMKKEEAEGVIAEKNKAEKKASEEANAETEKELKEEARLRQLSQARKAKAANKKRREAQGG